MRLFKKPVFSFFISLLTLFIVTTIFLNLRTNSSYKEYEQIFKKETSIYLKSRGYADKDISFLQLTSMRELSEKYNYVRVEFSDEKGVFYHYSHNKDKSIYQSPLVKTKLPEYLKPVFEGQPTLKNIDPQKLKHLEPQNVNSLASDIN